MADQALLHFSTDGEELFGAWVNGEHGPESFYSAGETDGDAQYGEAVIGGYDWPSAVERLPETGGYVCHWAATDRQDGETAADVFKRVDKS